MRKPFKIFAGLVLALILLLLLLRRQPLELMPPQAQSLPAPLPAHKPMAAFTTLEERITSLQVPYDSPLQAAMLWSNAFPEQAIRYAAVVGSMNAPIHFYGLCADQDGKPLPGVSLKMGVRRWKGFSPVDLRGEGEKFDRTSDATGRFELTGTTGDVAGVDEAFKPGYVWIRSGTVSIDFSVSGNRVPNPSKPVILQFWKQHGAEPLFVAQPFNFQPVSCNGTPISYDLVTGMKTAHSSNPTVQFSMVRNPESLPQQTKGKFDWEFSVSLPGGGVQWTTTNMPFYAPASGYEPRATLSFKADDADWQSQVKPTLYFRTAGGHYGRMTLWVLADRSGPSASFEWTSYLNPSGSPVLEYDSAKRLKAPSGAPRPAFRGVVPQQQPGGVAPQPPAQKGPVPFVPPPPPTFHALTNRGNSFTPPDQARPR